MEEEVRGPGRPPRGLVNLHVQTSEETVEGIKALAKGLSMSQGDIVNFLWRQYIKTVKDEQSKSR